MSSNPISLMRYKPHQGEIIVIKTHKFCNNKVDKKRFLHATDESDKVINPITGLVFRQLQFNNTHKYVRFFSIQNYPEKNEVQYPVTIITKPKRQDKINNKVKIGNKPMP